MATHSPNDLRHAIPERTAQIADTGKAGPSVTLTSPQKPNVSVHTYLYTGGLWGPPRQGNRDHVQRPGSSRNISGIQGFASTSCCWLPHLELKHKHSGLHQSPLGSRLGGTLAILPPCHRPMEDGRGTEFTGGLPWCFACELSKDARLYLINTQVLPRALSAGFFAKKLWLLKLERMCGASQPLSILALLPPFPLPGDITVSMSHKDNTGAQDHLLLSLFFFLPS